MKIETMIYIYIAICISMIVYNCVYVFIIRGRERRLEANTEDFSACIREQLKLIGNGKTVSANHIEFMSRKLKRISNLTAFDKCMEAVGACNSRSAQKYIRQIYQVFLCLIKEYRERDTVKVAYFLYIVGKYNVLENADDEMGEILFELLRTGDVYCRENALKAIYAMKSCDAVVKALKIIDTNLSFHHPKLVCDGLMNFEGNKDMLAAELLENLDKYSEDMQLNILNYIRFAGIRCDGKMLGILKDDRENQELRFCAIRYFEKYPVEEAKEILQKFAENKEELAWQYQAIASSALKSYPDKRTFEILKSNLSSANWYVRLNSAISCERSGYTYTELINIFDGNDRYAREILRYCLDRRTAKEKVVAS